MRERVLDEKKAELAKEESKVKQTQSLHISNLKYCFILFIAIGFKSWQPIAVGMSKQPDGTYTYNKTWMVIFTECFKLVFCIVAFLCQYFSTEPVSRHLLHNLPFAQSLHFVIPSILYAIANTLVYIGMSYINPALFHVFGNIRIMTAGVLYRIFMNRPQNDLQWMALVILTCGAVLASPQSNMSNNPNENNTLGLLAGFMMCLCSSASSIYTEINYKKTAQLSIFYQNIVLYLYGILINLIWLVYSDFENLTNAEALDGFDVYALHVLIAQSLMGISLSFIFKYLDNIVYVIAFTVSMFVSAFLSVFLFEFTFTIQFGIALLLVTFSVYLYYRDKILEKFGLNYKTAVF